jgi:hypothetical protein
MSDRIDIYLRSVEARVASLPGLEQRLMSPLTSDPYQQRVDRDDAREAWDVAMASLEWLDERYASGMMGEQQAKRYRTLVCQIRDALPTIDRLSLTPPRMSIVA